LAETKATKAIQSILWISMEEKKLSNWWSVFTF
jgi:hypothetical protein